jgi:hypothetical protein
MDLAGGQQANGRFPSGRNESALVATIFMEDFDVAGYYRPDGIIRTRHPQILHLKTLKFLDIERR